MSTITHINPPELHTNPAYSQGILAEGGKTLYIGGQNGTDSDGNIVAGGIAEQTTQAIKNLQTVLAAAKARPEHVVKLNVYLAVDADLEAGYAATVQTWGEQPTAVTVLRVAAIGRPGALVEIDAIAQIP
jgi:enamine deaminase RidA (YjgF/YER057c/UK114 family)